MAETTFRSSLMRRVVRKVVVLSLISLAALIVLSMTAPRPSNLGPRNGRLAELPDSPNCVASMTDKTASKMEPLDVSRFDRQIESLKKVIAATVPRSQVVTESEGYLRYEFTSRFFRFVDDGEFLLDPEKKLIQFRSAARVGYSDLGKNRKRMEKIAVALAELDD